MTILTYCEQTMLGAKETNTSIATLPRERSNELRDKITNMYAPNRSNSILWDAIAASGTEGFSIGKIPDGWRLIADIIGIRQCLLFFDKYKCQDMFEFQNGEDLVRVIGETSASDLYVTNYAAEFILCVTHHDALLAYGIAINWLQGYADSN